MSISIALDACVPASDVLIDGEIIFRIADLWGSLGNDRLTPFGFESVDHLQLRLQRRLVCKVSAYLVHLVHVPVPCDLLHLPCVVVVVQVVVKLRVHLGILDVALGSWVHLCCLIINSPESMLTGLI